MHIHAHFEIITTIQFEEGKRNGKAWYTDTSEYLSLWYFYIYHVNTRFLESSLNSFSLKVGTKKILRLCLLKLNQPHSPERKDLTTSHQKVVRIDMPRDVPPPPPSDTWGQERQRDLRELIRDLAAHCLHVWNANASTRHGRESSGAQAHVSGVHLSPPYVRTNQDC